MMRQKKVFFVWVNIFSMCIVYVLVLVLEVYPKHSALKSEKMLFVAAAKLIILKFFERYGPDEGGPF